MVLSAFPQVHDSVHFRSFSVGSGRILATGIRHIPCRTRSDEIPTGSVLEVVGTCPAKRVRESGSMETVGTRRIRPIPTGTDRNNPTETGSESDCKDPADPGRFRPCGNDLGFCKPSEGFSLGRFMTVKVHRDQEGTRSLFNNFLLDI